MLSKTHYLSSHKKDCQWHNVAPSHHQMLAYLPSLLDGHESPLFLDLGIKNVLIHMMHGPIIVGMS